MTEAHPRASGNVLPDPEAIARDLDALEAELVEGDGAAARVLDELQLLAGRVEWIEDEVARQHLAGRIAALRERAAP